MQNASEFHISPLSKFWLAYYLARFIIHFLFWGGSCSSSKKHAILLLFGYLAVLFCIQRKSLLNMTTINADTSVLEMEYFLMRILYLKNVAGVHDSFWTHACDVDQMNQILREKYVELYSMPVLENVSELWTWDFNWRLQLKLFWSSNFLVQTSNSWCSSLTIHFFFLSFFWIFLLHSLHPFSIP